MQQTEEFFNQLPGSADAVFGGADISGRVHSAFGQQFVADFFSILLKSLTAAVCLSFLAGVVARFIFGGFLRRGFVMASGRVPAVRWRRSVWIRVIVVC